MKRKILIRCLAVVASVLLIIWAASRWFSFHAGASALFTPRQVLCDVQHGRFSIGLRYQQQVAAPRPDERDLSEWGGFGWHRFAGVYLDDEYGTFWYDQTNLVTPMWFLVLLVGGYPAVFLIRSSLIPWYRGRRARHAGH
jgi:hypothetical protein